MKEKQKQSNKSNRIESNRIESNRIEEYQTIHQISRMYISIQYVSIILLIPAKKEDRRMIGYHHTCIINFGKVLKHGLFLYWQQHRRITCWLCYSNISIQH